MLLAEIVICERVKKTDPWSEWYGDMKTNDMDDGDNSNDDNGMFTKNEGLTSYSRREEEEDESVHQEGRRGGIYYIRGPFSDGGGYIIWILNKVDIDWINSGIGERMLLKQPVN